MLADLFWFGVIFLAAWLAGYFHASVWAMWAILIAFVLQVFRLSHHLYQNYHHQRQDRLDRQEIEDMIEEVLRHDGDDRPLTRFQDKADNHGG